MNAERFKQQKHKLADAFKEAIAADTPKEITPTQTVGWLIPLLLIGTMLPFQIAVAFFSFTSTLTLIALFFIVKKRKSKINTPAKAMVTALIITSILSGCGPVLFNETLPDFGGLERRTDIKTNTITRVGAFGFGLKDATPEQAQLEGNIEDLVAIKIDRGYGLISMARISVAGK